MTFMPDLPNAIPSHDFCNEDGRVFAGGAVHPGYRRYTCSICGRRFWASASPRPDGNFWTKPNGEPRDCGAPKCMPEWSIPSSQ